MPVSYITQFLRKVFSHTASDQELIRSVAAALDATPNPDSRESIAKFTEGMLGAGETALAVHYLRVEYEERELDSPELRDRIRDLTRKYKEELEKLFQGKYDGF